MVVWVSLRKGVGEGECESFERELKEASSMISSYLGNTGIEAYENIDLFAV